MKKSWPTSQILLLTCIVMAIIAVVISIIITNTTLRSVEKNLPNTLVNELISLDLVLEHLSDVVSSAELTAADTSPQNFDRLTQNVQTTFKSLATLRRTYVFDNLIQASAFHAIAAPALEDLQVWLTEGVSGYGPESRTTARVILSRISVAFKKAKNINRQSVQNAQNKLDEERGRLGRFLSSVNLLFMVTLLVSLLMILLFVRQHLLKIREIKSQEDMKAQSGLLNSLFDNILLGITVWSPDGRLLFANKHFTKLTGYLIEELKNRKTWLEKAYPDRIYRKRVIKEWKKFSQLNNVSGEYAVTCKNTQVKDIEFLGTFLPDGRALLTLTDITERKLDVQALRESEQRMRAILESSPDPMILYDQIGHPKYVNPSFTEVYGWTLDDLKEKPIPFVPRDQAETTARKIKEIYTHGDPLRFETKRYTRDHQVLCVILSAAVTKDNDGKPTGMVVNLTDITQRKILEAQYEQAQKMEALGTLAGGIAHDFNNLLSGIFGYLNLAQKMTKEPKTAEYLAKAFNASQRAEGLTRQLLTFSKGGAPVKKVEPLVPFLQETALFALSGADVSCRFDLPCDLWMCNYDKNQMGQVINNIIINANHAMPFGGTIQMTAINMTLKEKEHHELAPGKYVKISISDSGQGIAKETISRIFNPFFTTKKEGTGLGLATSYSIVKRHNGMIEVESVLGTGTTFHIFIPAKEHHKLEEKISTDNHYQGSGRILVMDDEPYIREMLTDMFDTMGLSATTTSDGREALGEFKKAVEQNTPFEAVILDLTVPGGMGGKETVKEIRRQDKTIPIFVASGYSDDEAIANPEAFGFTAGLQKPFSINKLARMFEKYLR